MNCKQDFPQISIFGASLETNELNPANSLVLQCNSNAFLSVSHPLHIFIRFTLIEDHHQISSLILSKL